MCTSGEGYEGVPCACAPEVGRWVGDGTQVGLLCLGTCQTPARYLRCVPHERTSRSLILKLASQALICQQGLARKAPPASVPGRSKHQTVLA